MSDSGHIWAVAFDGLHYGTYGGHGPGEVTTASPQLYISGMIEFVSDPSGSVLFGLGCPSG